MSTTMTRETVYETVRQVARVTKDKSTLLGDVLKVIGNRASRAMRDYIVRMFQEYGFEGFGMILKGIGSFISSATIGLITVKAKARTFKREIQPAKSEEEVKQEEYNKNHPGGDTPLKQFRWYRERKSGRKEVFDILDRVSNTSYCKGEAKERVDADINAKLDNRIFTNADESIRQQVIDEDGYRKWYDNRHNIYKRLIRGRCLAMFNQKITAKAGLKRGRGKEVHDDNDRFEILNDLMRDIRVYEATKLTMTDKKTIQKESWLHRKRLDGSTAYNSSICGHLKRLFRKLRILAIRIKVFIKN